MKTTEPARCETPSDDVRPIAVQGEAVLRQGPGPEQRSEALRPGCRVEVHATERDSFTEYYITGTVGPGKDGTDELLAQVAAAVAERGIQPIQEKYYGLAGARDAVLKRREAALRREELDLSVPVTWIQGTPLKG